MLIFHFCKYSNLNFKQNLSVCENNNHEKFLRFNVAENTKFLVKSGGKTWIFRSIMTDRSYLDQFTPTSHENLEIDFESGDQVAEGIKFETVCGKFFSLVFDETRKI